MLVVLSKFTTPSTRHTVAKGIISIIVHQATGESAAADDYYKEEEDSIRISMSNG